jgi:rhodanese-related sulfurtransferase
MMNLISRDELKAKLDAGHNVQLVMMLSEYDYRALHIPGSLHFYPITLQKEWAQADLSMLKPDGEIVVYATNEICPTGRWGYQLLTANGFDNVYLYKGGIVDWEDAGYPLEGEMA